MRLHRFLSRGKKKRISISMDLEFSCSFFPPPISPVVSVLANTIFEIFVKIKLCKPFVKKYNVASTSNLTITIPGAEAADTDRRRLETFRVILQITLFFV